VKILVVRFSSIGDIVLTTPILRVLKEQLDNPEIHYVTKRKFASILDGNPHVDKVFTMEKSIDELLEDLKKENYDHIIDLHNNVRTLSLKKKLGRPAHTFQKLNWKKWLLVKLKMDKMPDLHVVDRYFGAVRSLGVKKDGKTGDFFISQENEINVQEEFGLVPKSFVTIAIGAQFNTKRMPAELIVNIINKLEIPIVLVGGETDIKLSKAIQDKSEKKIHDACGKFNLAQSASIVGKSAKLLTNDTGMMHIASCLDIPIVSVWGSTVPSLGMYPYYPNQKEMYSIHEVKDLGCRPCSKIGYQKCPKAHFKCMREQDADGIVKNILNLN